MNTDSPGNGKNVQCLLFALWKPVIKELLVI